MRNHVAAAAVLTALVFVSGCETVPDSSSPTANTTPVASRSGATAAPDSKIVAPKALTADDAASEAKASPVQPTLEPPKLSAETSALVERLTSNFSSGTLPHELTSVTGFPGALQSLEAGAPQPQVEPIDVSGQPPVRGLTADGNTTALIEKDWTGLVLVPISTSLSKAYTSDVRLNKVEAHPLNDGRVRIWTRVHNIGRETLPAEIACEFRMSGSHANSPYFYQLQVPAQGFRDVFFISPDGALNSYTVLVRSTEALRR